MANTPPFVMIATTATSQNPRGPVTRRQAPFRRDVLASPATAGVRFQRIRAGRIASESGRFLMAITMVALGAFAVQAPIVPQGLAGNPGSWIHRAIC